MIKIFKTFGGYVEFNEPQRGCWINIISPTEREIQLLIDEFRLPSDVINDILDQDERPRIEFDDTWTLIILRVPVKIEINDTNTILDLMNPWNNEVLAKDKKNMDNIKITILKPIFNNDMIAVVDALGEKGKTVKVYLGKKLLGSYKTLISYSGKDFKTNRKVNGQNEFPLYKFVKRTN